MNHSTFDLLNSHVLPAMFTHNLIIVCPRTAGGETLRFLADTGGGCIITPEAVGRTGLVTSESIVPGDDSDTITVELPPFLGEASIPELLMDGKPGKLLVHKFREESDGIIGQAWFADRGWTFDYWNERFLYHGNVVPPEWKKGQCVRLGFQEDGHGRRLYHFPRIQAVIDGETIDLLFDTGASIVVSDQAIAELNDGRGRVRGTSFITETMFRKWMRRHLDWRIIHYAEQGTRLPMIEVPVVTIAGHAIGPVWFTFRFDRDFHQFVSKWTDERVEGALGGNALRHFRITADYPNALAYFER